MTPKKIIAKSFFFFLAAFVFAGLGFAIQLFLPQLAYAQLPMFGPALAALLFVSIEKQNLAGFLKERFAFRINRPVLLILAVPLLIHGWVSFLWGGFAANMLDFSSEPALYSFFLVWMLPAVIGEELGWRGYLLPRLQERFSPLVSTLILTLLWAAWHIPVRLGLGLAGFVYWLLQLVGISFLATAAYNKAKPSIWPAILLHYAVNVTSFLLLPNSTAALPLAAAWLAVALLVIGLERNGFLAQPSPPVAEGETTPALA